MCLLRGWLKLIALLFVMWAIATYPQACHSEEYLYDFEISPSFISGDYGTDDDVDTFYLPFIFSFYPSQKVRGTVVVPWVYQSSTQVTFAGAMGRHSFQTVEGATDSDASGMGHHSFQTVEGSRDSESGWGDIILQGEYALLLEPMDSFNFLLEGTVKLPTASESKGLGTGETDVGLAAELGRTVNQVYYFGRLGYTVVGEPSGINFDNPFLYEGGISFPINPQFYLTLSLEGSTSIDDDLDDPLEGVVSGDYQWGADLSLNGFFLVGLSDGSPDYGIGIGFSKRL